MILYHGSSKIVSVPTFGAGRKENDYGLGFYCTQSLELAKEWACPVPRDGFANKYSFNTDGLNILRLNNGEYHILNWLAILLSNRTVDINKNNQVGILGRDYIIENFMPDIKDYDVIIGYRADDRYFAFAKDFVQNGISVSQLANAMKLGELGEQVVLKSETAFKNIKFDSYEIADSSIYYTKRFERETNANELFNNMHNSSSIADSDVYMLDILREGIKNDDTRLR